MPKFFKDFTIPYYAVKCKEKMLERHLDEMRKFFCQGVPDCVFNITLDSCEANPDVEPTVSSFTQSSFCYKYLLINAKCFMVYA